VVGTVASSFRSWENNWEGFIEIRVEKSDPHMIEERKVKTWPFWKKEVSRFDWHYEPPRSGGASIELSKKRRTGSRSPCLLPLLRSGDEAEWVAVSEDIQAVTIRARKTPAAERPDRTGGACFAPCPVASRLFRVIDV
jgi:hypothetical protein